MPFRITPKTHELYVSNNTPKLSIILAFSHWNKTKTAHQYKDPETANHSDLPSLKLAMNLKLVQHHQNCLGPKNAFDKTHPENANQLNMSIRASKLRKQNTTHPRDLSLVKPKTAYPNSLPHKPPIKLYTLGVKKLQDHLSYSTLPILPVLSFAWPPK